MKVLFNTTPTAFFQKGGGEVQLLESKWALESIGIDVQLFSMWEPQRGFEIFHQFSIEPGVENIVAKYHEMGKKIALSPIMWSLYSKEHPEYIRIKRLLKMADILFTNSNVESERLANWFDIDISCFHKTRNSISEAFLTQGSPEMFRSTFEVPEKFILCVANIDRRKNTHALLNACDKLGLSLVTIGHVKDTEYFQSFAKKRNNLIHLGPIENESLLKSAYSACDIFALPSICETPGIAALEAASQGAKVVITQEGSTSEYFEDFVHYLDPMSEESILKALKGSMESSLSSRLQDLVKTRYRWTETAKEISSGYEKIR